jgi:hypothetical protein
MALASIQDRAHHGTQVTLPVGANPVRDLPKDHAYANGVLAGIIRGGNGRIVQKSGQVVLNVSTALLQPSAVGIGELGRETAAFMPAPSLHPPGACRA